MKTLLLRVVCAGLACIAGPAYAYPQNDGWPIEWYVSPSEILVLDFDGDGDLEVLNGSTNYTDPHLGAWDHRGQPIAGWPFPLPEKWENGLSAGDIDNDGLPEVVIAPNFSLSPSTVMPLRFDGTLPEGWPVLLPLQTPVPLTLFDFDGEGKLEVLIVTNLNWGQESELHLLRADGTSMPGWPIAFPDQHCKSGPAIADLDLDGDHEIVVGTYQDRLNDPGYLYAFNHDGSAVLDSTLFATLAEPDAMPILLADLFGDARPEVVAHGWRSGIFYVLNSLGEHVPEWQQTRGTGAMDNMPVYFRRPNSSIHRESWGLWGSSDAATSFIYDSTGALWPGWPWYGSFQIRSQVVVADLDGDPELEGFIGGDADHNWALELDGTVVEGWPHLTYVPDYGTAHLTDLDGDGDTDIVFPSGLGISVYDTPGRYDYRRIECHRYQYDNWSTGAYDKEIYREAEAANSPGQWTVVSDTSAWGHAAIRYTGTSANADEDPLFYRFESPVYEAYSLWVRVRMMRQGAAVAQSTTPDLPLEITLDGVPASAQLPRESAPSPGPWLWVKLAERPLRAGIHELRLRTTRGAERVVLDRWLLTTREHFPLLQERPHAW